MTLVPIEREKKIDEAMLSPVVREAMATARGRYGTTFQLPWVSYLAEENGKFIGSCCFLSAPSNGKTEIRFFTFPDNEQKGVATRMCGELIRLARRHMPSVVLTAQTLPEENAATTVLRRNGFKMVGAYVHPENGTVWQWELRP
jgi:RimJ/RimL family protein N-acetyltransferase